MTCCYEDALAAGAAAAGQILRDAYGIDVEKALDPLDDPDFVVISARLARALGRATRGAEGAALDAAIRGLDVDWANLSDAGRERIIAGARASLAAPADKVLPGIDTVLERAAGEIIPGTRSNAIRRFGLRITPDLHSQDARTGQFLRRSTALFVTDEYGRRSQAASAQARGIVASALQEGLGSSDITARLTAALGTTLRGRSEAYWEIIAMTFANRARTTTQVNAFSDAGVELYQFIAILDEVTTDTCRFFDGRVFRVESALSQIRRVQDLSDPQAIKNAQPWVSVGRSPDGREGLFFRRGERRHLIAEIEESRVGEKDRKGSFSQGMSDGQLATAGLILPPLHGRCRSTIGAV